MWSYGSTLRQQEVIDLLVGQSVIEVDDSAHCMILSNGVVLEFEKETADCCSWLELDRLNTTNSIITDAKFWDNEDKTGGEGAYKASLHVLTSEGPVNVAEAHGDASNGYYLHGFALGVRVLDSIRITWFGGPTGAKINSETHAVPLPESDDHDDVAHWAETILWPIVRRGPRGPDQSLTVEVEMHNAASHGDKAARFRFNNSGERIT